MSETPSSASWISQISFYPYLPIKPFSLSVEFALTSVCGRRQNCSNIWSYNVFATAHSSSSSFHGHIPDITSSRVSSCPPTTTAPASSTATTATHPPTKQSPVAAAANGPTGTTGTPRADTTSPTKSTWHSSPSSLHYNVCFFYGLP